MISKEYIKDKMKDNVLFHQQTMQRRMNGEKVDLCIYSKNEIYRDFSKSHVKITPFLIGGDKPTVIICPGGAYQFISRVNEGIDIALTVNKKGYNAFILSYSVGKHARFPAPMNDLAQCISYIKKHADVMNINANKIHLIGSSAGGHLCAYFGANYKLFEQEYEGETFSLRPASIVLAYPVISMSKDFHRITRTSLLGINPTEFEIADKSINNIVDSFYPPTFFWHCKDDTSVPYSNSLKLEEVFKKKGIEHEMKLYATGGHGIGLGLGTDAAGWIDEAVDFIGRYV